MKLFDLNLPSPASCAELLYFRAQPSVKRESDSLIIDCGNSVSFDTYFNCFSYLKYTKYTLLAQLGISLTLKGAFDVKLFMHTASPNKKYLLKQLEFASAQKDELSIFYNISQLTEEGYLYIELTSRADNSVFYEGEYFSEDSPCNNANISLVFCTYKREEYLTANLKSIKAFLDDNTDISDKFQVLIIDNGNTLQPEQVHGFKLFPNKNLGGSGGFTRGIIEAYKTKESFSHFLLMDDDITFDPKILRKTLSLLSLAKNIDSLAIGGAMLELNKPYNQYEMGGKTTGLSLSSMRHNFDVSDNAALLNNENEEIADYNAWWYMCMPISSVNKIGLPLPLFIKGDDVEYGLRFRGDILVINGIGVWHESFDNKHSAELEYYVKRNEMLISALYFPSTGIVKHVRKLIRAVGFRLVYHRYYEMDLIFKAYNDFLKGPMFLGELDAAALHQELRSKAPQYLNDLQLLQNDNVEFNAIERDDKTTSSYTKQLLTLNGYLIPECFYSKKDKLSYRVVDVIKSQPVDFYKAIQVLQYNPVTRKGFVTRLQKGKLFSAAIQIIYISLKLLFKYKKVSAAYRKAMPDLTSFEQWNKRLFK
ncbi:glycosyltransferase family 2 protein [bacterium]|nr:glycosyltransferase family 2 protein [bacterium]